MKADIIVMAAVGGSGGVMAAVGGGRRALSNFWHVRLEGDF
jgi:hypothetical protein